MTIAISVTALIEAIALVYFGLVILEIRYKMNNVYPELIKIINDQQNVLQGTLDSIHRWSDISADIVDHIERVEDMEGDIKDIFEWIHSVDDNIADMRKDIQKIFEKFDEDAYHYINASTMKAKDIDANLIQHSIDYSALYDKLFSKRPPLDTHLDDQKGDEANEQT